VPCRKSANRIELPQHVAKIMQTNRDTTFANSRFGGPALLTKTGRSFAILRRALRTPDVLLVS
jgi:hypothetical protein